MRALLWKEWRENVKWACLPALLILLPLVLLGGPGEPMPGVSGAFIFYLTAAVFGAGLGFVQVFFEAQGDRRALLLHRPLGRSRIFLGKVLAGLGIYLLAQGIPFACVQGWMATPGHMSAPYHWRTGLPWLADILAGVVYYFVGMLTAQREARWYGSRGLGLAAAFFCTFLVWTLPEFWQAVVAIGVLGTFVGVAAWGSFLSGGAYAPQPRLAKVALALTLLTGLFVVSFIAKVMIGEWFAAGVSYSHVIDRQGRVLIVLWKQGRGPTEIVSVHDGQVPPGLQGKRVDRNALQEIEAPWANMEWPIFRSYRNPGRFYVEYGNASRPGNERWFYVPAQGRLLGYDAEFGQLLGSFGPDGFVPPDGQAREHFEGELSYPTRLWEAHPPSYLPFPGGVYAVDFSRRTIQKLFTPAAGETVLWASRWQDKREKESLAIVSTDQSVHVLTEAGARVVAVSRDCDRQRYRVGSVGRLEDPQRYAFWYAPLWCLELEEFQATPPSLREYDAAGREVARRTLPKAPRLEPSYAEALFGLVTPLTEAASLVGANRYMRSEARATGGRDEWVIQYLLEEWTQHFIPGMRRGTGTKSALLPAYAALMLLSAAACALVCYVLARRYAFSRGRCLGWALGGFFFGVVGLLLMLALQEWPARIACPSCRQARVVDRERCEHCGAAHAPPAPDGTEVFEQTAATPQPVAVWN
jgi:hypothetical protein